MAELMHQHQHGEHENGDHDIHNSGIPLRAGQTGMSVLHR
jgi:hypothetical protein